MSNISEYPGSILTYFTGLVDKLVEMIIQIFVWWSPKGRCYGNQLNSKDGRSHLQERPLLLASAFENALADRKCTFNRYSGYIVYTFGRHSAILSIPVLIEKML